MQSPLRAPPPAPSNTRPEDDAEESPLGLSIDRPAALKEAERRLRRLPEIEASRARTNTEALDECLDAAVEVVQAHARPAALYAACRVRREGGAVRLGRARVSNERLKRRLADGERAVLYLATVGYTNIQMFEAVERDYVAYHFQYLLSRQLLYAVANQAYAAIRLRQGPAYLRYAVLEGRRWEAGEARGSFRGRSSLWDPQAVAHLFAVFAGNAIGVSLTESQGLNPIDSLLGVMLRRRGAEESRAAGPHADSDAVPHP